MTRAEICSRVAGKQAGRRIMINKMLLSTQNYIIFPPSLNIQLCLNSAQPEGLSALLTNVFLATPGKLREVAFMCFIITMIYSLSFRLFLHCYYWATKRHGIFSPTDQHTASSAL